MGGQPQQFSPQRMQVNYSNQIDDQHMPLAGGQHSQMPPRDFQAIKPEQTSSNSSPYQQQAPSIPNVLQPGGMSSRPQVLSTNTAPSLPTLQTSMLSSSSQHTEYHTPSKPSGPTLSHTYSRSSPAAGYEPSSSYHAYNPTTPGSTGHSPFLSSNEGSFGGLGPHRIPNAPLGLADIRPRADSAISDGIAGSLAYDMANSQSGPSSYVTPWTTYAFDWCKSLPQSGSSGKLAVGSFLEDGHNYINILDSHTVPIQSEGYNPGAPKHSLEFNKIAEATHSYPVTRLVWEPQSSQKQSTELLATSGDHLRLWSLPSDSPPPSQGNTITRPGRDNSPSLKLTPLALLSNSKTPDHTAPLTSLDWNTVSPSLIITSSIDTTCTIWDIPSLTAKTQLIAHDKEVYDVRFCANSVDVFVSCGQDGSVRMFDLRSLEHSTIIYEPTTKDDRDSSGGRMSPTLAQQTMSSAPPLLRLATSPHDAHLLATFAQDSNVIRLLDVRQPGQALLELRGHSAAINCLDWSPTKRGTLVSGGDDCQVLIWDLLNSPSSSAGQPVNGAIQPECHRSPVQSWQCDYEIGNVGWVPRLAGGDYGEWLGVSAGRGIWGVRLA